MARFGRAMLFFLAACRSLQVVADDHRLKRNGAQLVDPDRLPLHTSGRYIVDKRGFRVKWACVNWYGAYSSKHAVGGLEVRPMKDIVDTIVDIGFNCVRAMYSVEGYVNNPLVDNETLAANPDLVGKRFLELFDLHIQMMTDAGLMVIVNNHNSKSGWCCHYSQDEGLWYAPPYPEDKWIESLVFFAARYRTNPLVVAIDLRNEVHDFEDTKLTWGEGDEKTDWAAAATRAGNAVLDVSPDVIIVVMGMCFGADLRPMKKKPIQLQYPNRVVYQTHNYLEYQVFNNVSQMFLQWKELRVWVMFFSFILLALLWMLRALWLQLGKPTPHPSVVVISVTAWVILFASIAANVTWSFYGFGSMFCAVGAKDDVLPWFYGSLIIVGVALFLMLCSIVHLFRRPKSVMQATSSTSDASASEAEPIIYGKHMAQDATGPSPKVSNERDEDAAGPNPEVPNDRAEATPKDFGAAPTEDLKKEANTDDCHKGTDDMHANVESAAKPEEPKCYRCCAPGFESWRLAARRGCKPCFLGPKSVQSHETATWDYGMCCVMQCAILTVIVLGLFIWLYIFAHIFPTYWWMERNLDGLWGFALEEGQPYTAPVWMGEFGHLARGEYWLNFMRYLSHRDVDFAYWAINGRKFAEGYIDSTGEFTNYDVPRWDSEWYGLLNDDYHTIRHTWKVHDLVALFDSPARWTPDTYPCKYDMSPSCGG